MRQLAPHEWDAASVDELGIKQAQKLGLVMAVKSKALDGETIILAPSAVLPGETRVVYSWREAFILAKAKDIMTPGMLRVVHELKRAFGSETAVQGVRVQDDGRVRIDTSEGGPLLDNERDGAEPKGSSPPDNPPEPLPESPAIPRKASGSPATDACLLDDLLQSTGRSLASLLPRKSSRPKET